MSDAIMAPQAARPQRGFGFGRRLARLVSSFAWATEMSRRCEREASGNRPLNDEALRRIIAEVDAWAANRSR